MDILKTFSASGPATQPNPQIIPCFTVSCGFIKFHPSIFPKVSIGSSILETATGRAMPARPKRAVEWARR